jgi:putative transposase
MARLGRYFLPDQPLHVIQRGNNRAPIFFHDEDYARYRRWLGEAAARYGCAVHAYLLMTNHVHLLVTPQADGSLPGAMQSLGRRYVRYVNATYRRTGTLWEGRYRAAPIDSEAYFLACARYIEANPVRAGMVAHPSDYGWSSWGAHALGRADPLVTDHPIYRALGRSARAPTARSSSRRRTTPFSMPSVAPPTAAGPWATSGLPRQSPPPWAAAPLPRGRAPKPTSEPGQGNLL